MGLDKYSPLGNTMQLMELKSWLALERGRSLALAKSIGVPTSFISKMSSGEKPIPLEHMAPIEAFTGKQVTRQEMCSDKWQKIWPELAALESIKPDDIAVEVDANAPLTTDPALQAELSRAEQAGLVLLPKQTPAWDGVERRKSARRAGDRELADVGSAGRAV